MKTWYSPISLVVIAFAVGCSSAPAPKAADEDPATKKEGAAAAAKKKDSLSRADEIIADLRKREAEQGKIQQKNREAIPVVVEVTPTKGPSMGGFAPSGGVPPAGSRPAAIPVVGGMDPNRARQEVSIAEAQVQSANQRLQAAQQRLSMAQAQANDQNAAVRSMGAAALQSAQQEVYAAQSAVSQAQSALSSARSNVR
jgi:hypothetical protein